MTLDESRNEQEIVQRLFQARSTVAKICHTSGVPGASIGILHCGKVLFTDNFGYQDVDAKVVPTSDTIYGAGSLTKAFVAAAVAKLYDEHDTLRWDTPISDIIPDFKPKDQRLQKLLSIADLLSHRSGLDPDLSIAFQGDGDFVLPPEELIRTVNDLDSVAPFRQRWIYNNWGYSIAAAVIEKLSGIQFHHYVEDKILKPLGLASTTTRPDFKDEPRYAEPYTALHDGSFHHLQKRQQFKNSLLEAAGGIHSTVNDLLKWSAAVLQARRDPSKSILKQIPTLQSSQIPLHFSSEEFGFYGMGWMRTQLPGTVGLLGGNTDLFDAKSLPVLGDGSSPMVTLYHQGQTIGFVSSLYLFPETDSAVVVLTNSMAVNDAADWIAQVYLSALFGFSNGADYVEWAERSKSKRLDAFNELQSYYESIRKENGSATYRQIDSYTGSYINHLHNFFLEIRQHREKENCLEILFQGREDQNYELRHLHDDVFEWALTFDERARRGRRMISDPGYFIIDFCFAHSKQAASLTWAGKKGDNSAGKKLLRVERESNNE